MQIAALWHAILCAVQDWWNDNCARTIQWGVVITSPGKPLGECVLAGCSLGIKNCPGYPPTRSGNICSMASKGNFCAIR